MGKTFDRIDSDLAEFIAKQKIFFVSTAPLAAKGHVNLSPKGLDTFRVLDERTVAYLDYVGSGVETIAHLRENGRIVIMFCAFEGPPKIVRLHGRGDVIESHEPDFETLAQGFSSEVPGRAIIRVHCERVSSSCGYGVPVFRFERDRKQLPDWYDRKGLVGIEKYKEENNRLSLDGLPGLKS